MRCVWGSPIRRTLDTRDDLLTQAVVLVGSTGLGRKGEDRFLVGRALLEADALGDGRLEDSVSEDIRDSPLDVSGKSRSLVVESNDGSKKLELRIRTGADLVD